MPRCTLDDPATFGHRFSPDIISHAVWLSHRYCLSFRDVEDLLAERGIIVSYETIRQWCEKFGLQYARRLCQVGVARTGIASDETATQTFGLGTGHLTPNPEGTCAQEAMVDGSQQVAAGAKEILHESVHR